MLTIIHGDDIASSRKKLREIVEENKESESSFLDGRKLTLEELVLVCESTSMLFAKKLVVIENFLGSKKSKDKEQIISYLNGESKNTDIILWDDKKIDRRTYSSSFKKFREDIFLLPANLFKFLEAVGVERKNSLILMFHQLLKTFESEMIYAMLIRQWRNMIIALDNKRLISYGLASWQLGKLKKQAGFIGLEKLISSYRALLSLDYKIKMGLTPLNMSQLLDIFLLNL